MAHPTDDYLPSGPRERRLIDRRPTRTRAAVRAGEPVVPPRVRSAKSDGRKAIERGLNGDTAGSALSRAIGQAGVGLDRRQVSLARELLYALDRHRAVLLTDPAAAAGVVRMCRFAADARRRPGDAELPAGLPGDQLRELAGRLFERWPVPPWLDGVWSTDGAASRGWFVHLGMGRNLSVATALPFPLTKRMAHFAVTAPDGLDAGQALRWGQLRGLGVPEELCRELVATRLSTSLPDEPFWFTVGRYFSANPEVIGHAAEIVDYLFAQRVGDFAQPADRAFKMGRRTPDRLLADVRTWHRDVNRQAAQRRAGPPRWSSCGIAGLLPEADAGVAPTVGPPAWAIVELTVRADLVAEGQALRHCVAGYAPLAAAGSSAIFSLRRSVDDVVRPMVTVEVRPATRNVVQARGLRNAVPTDDDRRLIEVWADKRNLTVEPLVFGAPGGRRPPQRRGG